MILFQLVAPTDGVRSDVDCVSGTFEDMADKLYSTYLDIVADLSKAVASGAISSDNPEVLLADAITKTIETFLDSFVLVLVDNSKGVGCFSQQPLFRVRSLFLTFKLELTHHVE